MRKKVRDKKIVIRKGKEKKKEKKRKKKREKKGLWANVGTEEIVKKKRHAEKKTTIKNAEIR